jgi:hypothetical protein
MLRHPAARIDHAPVDGVAEFLREHFTDHTERAALVVADKIADVLQKDRGWLVMLDDARHLEEQRALRITCKAVRPAERVLL